MMIDTGPRVQYIEVPTRRGVIVLFTPNRYSKGDTKTIDLAGMGFIYCKSFYGR